MTEKPHTSDADRFEDALRHLLSVKPDQIDPKKPVRPPHPPKKRKPGKKKG